MRRVEFREDPVMAKPRARRRDAVSRDEGGGDLNNAGIETPKAVPVHEQSLADFENVWRTNTAGVFLAMKYEIPHVLRRAAESFGMTYEQLAQLFPIERIVQPEEMARVVMWLASEDATAVVGTDIDATGGYLAG